MYEQRVSGSYYEMGLKIGTIFKKEFNVIEGFPPDFSEEKIKLGMEYEKEVKKYAPELLEELQGIADGSGIDYTVLAANELSPYRLQPSCLVMAISGEHTQSGLPMLARNHEWVEEDSQYLTLCYTKPTGKIGSFGFTFMTANMSRYGGINEVGLAIASTNASFVNSGPGVMINVATRWILDNCETTEEAAAFLKKIPKVWGIAYLIIDKNNTIAKVEAHRQKTKITYAEDGFELVTLLFDSPEMEQYNQIDEIAKLHYPRKAFLTKWFDQNKGIINDKLIIDALKDHEHAMCDHSSDGKFNYGICWSWIVTIGKNEALVCAGPPCKNEFKKHSIS
ncbi:MAG: C45 family autoproteolytic acyltransferase/hydrolase [Promethearchaeota archaeon]